MLNFFPNLSTIGSNMHCWKVEKYKKKRKVEKFCESYTKNSEKFQKLTKSTLFSTILLYRWYRIYSQYSLFFMQTTIKLCIMPWCWKFFAKNCCDCTTVHSLFTDSGVFSCFYWLIVVQNWLIVHKFVHYALDVDKSLKKLLHMHNRSQFIHR